MLDKEFFLPSFFQELIYSQTTTIMIDQNYAVNVKTAASAEHVGNDNNHSDIDGGMLKYGISTEYLTELTEKEN